MNKLAHYHNTRKKIAELQAELAEMEADSHIKRELEFETKLYALLNEYGLSPTQALTLIAPQIPPNREPNEQRRQRKMMLYKNPNSGEIVETKGGNNRVLRAWRAQYGADVVKGWKQASA